MSLRPQLVYLVPEETARIARAAFPRGNNPYMLIRDHLGMIYDDQDFAALFPPDGQPAEPPVHLALTLVMQFCEGLTDDQAADAVRSRIDWKYALALPLDDPGFDASVLCEFRSRLIEGKAERLIFDTLLTLLRDQGLVKAKGRQRTDSTHVLASIHALNRLELVGETLRAALNRLAIVAPDWLLRWVPQPWVDRYAKQLTEYRLPASEAERTRLAEQIGTDGRELLKMLEQTLARAWAREDPAMLTLGQVWQQQYRNVASDKPMQMRAADELPPFSAQICSPYDPDARYRRKRDTEWVGYAVHLTESCDDEGPHVLTNVETTPATTQDSQMLGRIGKQLAAHDLTPSEHYVDAGYPTGEYLVSGQAEGTEVIGPVTEEQSWQARAGEGFGAAQFEVDWEEKQARCPEGKTSVRWRPSKDSHGHAGVTLTWGKEDCLGCAVRKKCVKGAGVRRVTLRPQAEYEALREARARQYTEEFKEQYKRRAGIEGTVNQGVTMGALRRSRYVGLAKTRLLHLLIGAAMNVVRVAAWLAERPRAGTRTSSFARLGQAAAAL
jgi:transposase